MNVIHDLIEEICTENGISYKLLSRDWVSRLEKNGIVKFISGYKFDLNSHALGEVIDDKYALYEVLREENIPIIEHNILYSKDNNNSFAIGYNDYNKVFKYFNNHNNSIVIKTNNGTCGKEVFHITDQNNILETLDKLFINNYSISYCPFYNIKNEYRLIVLNKKIKLVYKKQKPAVIGDGKSTIKELLLKFNYSYFSNIELSDDLNRILTEDEIFEYDWKFNLSRGATATIVNEPILSNRLEKIANQIINKLDIRFVSIDIIETISNDLLVMEINSGVMMKNIMNILPNGKEIVKDIYKEAILSMFN